MILDSHQIYTTQWDGYRVDFRAMVDLVKNTRRESGMAWRAGPLLAVLVYLTKAVILQSSLKV
jgi:hypothetical protein